MRVTETRPAENSGVVMGHVTAANGLRTFPIIFAAAIAFHRFYWKPSGISDEIAKVTK